MIYSVGAIVMFIFPTSCLKLHIEDLYVLLYDVYILDSIIVANSRAIAHLYSICSIRAGIGTLGA